MIAKFHISTLTASQKVHLLRCASSFVTAAYFYVRLISQDSRALHLDLFTVPSPTMAFYEVINLDEFVKSPKVPFSVIPAKAGIQSFQALLDSRLRGSDGFGDFLRDRQP